MSEAEKARFDPDDPLDSESSVTSSISEESDIVMNENPPKSTATTYDLFLLYDVLVYSEFVFVPCQSIMFFFFFEGLTELVTNYYAIALSTQGDFDTTLNDFKLVFVFVGPVVTMLLGLIPGYDTSFNAQYVMGCLFGIGGIACRLVFGWLKNPDKFLWAVFSVMFYMAYFPTCAQHGGFSTSKIPEQDSLTMGVSLAFAIMLNVLFKSLNNTVDVLLYPLSEWYVVTVILAMVPLLTFLFIFLTQILDIVDTLLAKAKGGLKTAGRGEIDGYIKRFVPSICHKVETSKVPKLIRDKILNNKNKSSKRFYQVLGALAVKWELLEYGLRVMIIATGLISQINLIYFTSLNPSALTRWSNIDEVVLPFALMLCVSLTIYIYIALFRNDLDVFPKLRKPLNILANAITIAIVPSMAYFSSKPENLSVSFASMLIFCLLLLTPILVFNFQIMWYYIIKRKAHITNISIGFIIGFALVLLSNIFVIFTFEYTAVSFFKHRSWLTYLLIAMSGCLPIIFVPWNAYEYGDPNQKYQNIDIGKKLKRLNKERDRKNQMKGQEGLLDYLDEAGDIENDADFQKNEACDTTIRVTLLSFAFILVFFISLALILTPPPTSHRDDDPEISFLTLNIGLGYDANGDKAYDEYVKIIRDSGAHLVGLLESDTTKSTNGFDDFVRYCAVKLGYFSYYGAVPTSGSRGVSLLSKFRLGKAQTSYLLSTGSGRITVVVSAKIIVHQHQLTVLVTQFNNIDMAANTKEILTATRNYNATSDNYVLRDLDPVVLMADLALANTTSAEYKLLTKYYKDALNITGISSLKHHSIFYDNFGYSPVLNYSVIKTGITKHDATQVFFNFSTNSKS